MTLEMLRQEYLAAERRRTIDLMQEPEKVAFGAPPYPIKSFGR